MPNESPLLKCLAVLLFACSFSCAKIKEKPSHEPKLLRVLATTTIVEDLVRQNLGEIAQIESLMGPGTDPHLYVASPRDYEKVKKADIIVYSGLHLEAKLGDLLESLSKSKMVINLSAYIPKGRVISDSLKVVDPHFWFDPELWLFAGGGFSRAMQKKFPEHKIAIAERYNRWNRAVMESVAQAREAFKKIPNSQRVLVTSHDAFRYFARYFELEVMSVLGVSTDAQISIKKIETLVAAIKSRKIPSVFLESSVSPYAIHRIQEESGARIGGELYGDSLGGPDTVASTYVGMLKHNAAVVAEGLSHGTAK